MSMRLVLVHGKVPLPCCSGPPQWWEDLELAAVHWIEEQAAINDNGILACAGFV
jgi:hypothetical protein